MEDQPNNPTKDEVAALRAELEQLRRDHQTTVDLLSHVIPMAFWSAVGSRGALQFLAQHPATSPHDRSALMNSIEKLSTTRQALADAVLQVKSDEG